MKMNVWKIKAVVPSILASLADEVLAERTGALLFVAESAAADSILPIPVASSRGISRIKKFLKEKIFKRKTLGNPELLLPMPFVVFADAHTLQQSEFLKEPNNSENSKGIKNSRQTEKN